MSIIFIIGTVQAFFFSFLLLNKKKKKLSDKILCIWMFVLGLHLFLYYLLYIEYYHTFPFFMGFMQPLPLIHGPLLYLYVKSMIKPNPVIGKYELLHFVPASVFYVLIIPDTFLHTAQELREFAFTTLKTNPPLYWSFFMILINISGVIYAVWSLIFLMKHRHNIKNDFSYTDKINLSWLIKLIIGIAVIWAVVILIDEEYTFLVTTFFIFMIGYFGSRQGEIFTDNTTIVNPQKKVSEKGKYEKSSLTSEKSQEYLYMLKEFMEREKPYLETKITLKKISERLEMHPNHLSQVINENLNVNFYDFVNGYRVEEFKNRLATDTSKVFTLLAHAYDCGFSSKSSFNEVFKKFTGLTPSQYQKNLNS